MADCEPESLDLVIVDSTDPVGPAEGLFNAAFYASCHGRCARAASSCSSPNRRWCIWT